MSWISFRDPGFLCSLSLKAYPLHWVDPLQKSPNKCPDVSMLGSAILKCRISLKLEINLLVPSWEVDKA